MFGFLKTKLDTIDNSLREAVQTLSKGATEEIIRALEGVIQDFNNNLTEQFGENFKQLNGSVLKMIEWQENYKDSVQGFEEQLKRTTESTETSHAKTTALIENFITENNKALLENIETINSVTTKNTEALIEKVDDFYNDMNSYLKEEVLSITEKNVKQIEKITDDYAKIAAISENLEAVINTNQNQIENLENHLKAFAEISESAKGITKELKDFSDEIKGSLSNQSKALAKLTEEIENQLPDSLDTLNKSLTSLTTQFSTDYESFLGQVSKLMKDSHIN